MITIRRTMRADALHHVEPLDALLFEGERYAHEFIIGPGAADFTGFDVTARFCRADGQDVAVGGVLAQGAADIVLTPGCYAVPGAYRLYIYVTRTENAGQSNERTTTVCVYAFIGTVAATTGPNGVAGDNAPIIESLSQESRIAALEQRVTALEGQVFQPV